jgi:hypothetical protein
MRRTVYKHSQYHESGIEVIWQGNEEFGELEMDLILRIRKDDYPELTRRLNRIAPGYDASDDESSARKYEFKRSVVAICSEQEFPFTEIGIRQNYDEDHNRIFREIKSAYKIISEVLENLGYDTTIVNYEISRMTPEIMRAEFELEEISFTDTKKEFQYDDYPETKNPIDLMELATNLEVIEKRHKGFHPNQLN